ncbi:TPA: sigma-54 interaction domain-containing protein [Clostridioides difficile]|uniref:sigma-54 interaction domain-containing protein n=1 Tax=Clostridioides difficile TaxID=1496 RepID=UPI00093F9A63|nr:sigma 54-interacting transcriptional regulator [Clostridioides difficile]EII6782419.1 sigma 54-interacting transcriptional regulator [Clostridioides difficile]MDI6220361.1 sigma 54-interacting transcriptional regulator [Clostridioides difficile]MDN9158036.1 sigma 54-interacting transcriptional regulator [Clostridioides difficile]VHT00866.1 sigma-54 dependent transcriptional regulator [Clostridioides difficile]VHZ18512.1 sigma-54 dependent transcriptional regulator [Clostridioides difficile]
MKKSVALVNDSRKDLIDFLENNLKLVFGDSININRYFINEINDNDIINDDVILVMSVERLDKIINNILDKKKVIVVRRTFREDKIYNLLSLPQGTNVLIVNDSDETTLETISLFYKIGVTNIRPTPYMNDNNYKNIKIAITPGVPEKVPSFISDIFDLGHRYIDISTFIEIINLLQIDSKEIQSNLVKYSEEIISLDTGIKDKYKELFLKIEELDTILNLSKDGILFTSKDGEINTYNSKVKDILDINEDIYGKYIEDIFVDSLKVLLSEKEILDKVVVFNKKYINVNKKNIYNRDEKMGTYYSLQEITYIKKLEQNLTKKLREKGQIAKYTFKDIKTNSPKMFECIDLAKKVSKSDLSILIRGESGTGKELIAQSIHNNSNRKNQPFIAVNCAAVPENLLESQLFGYDKGTFTGGLKDGKQGLFELANNGTIFLDEIGDMPLELQTKLLRVLQEKQIMPVGSHNVINIDVRIISATNKNLEQMIDNSQFREDLYYRLNTIPINIPPLRERKEDILIIMEDLINKKLVITPEAKKLIQNYMWKGNIRELQNVTSYLNIMCEDIVLEKDLPPNLRSSDNKNTSLKLKYSKNDILNILEILILNKESDVGIGRGLILKALLDKNLQITEGKIKKIFEYLKKEELIICSSGRYGSKITQKGEDFYNKLKYKGL